ncbi:MAG: aldehyde ferredoxin oxidoreductase family protein [Chitinophagales bacterium]
MTQTAGRKLTVDLTAGASRVDPIPVETRLKYVGGRGLNIRHLLDEVPVDLDPLSPQSHLVFGVGPLNGTSFPGAGRFNVSAKSPQTGILGDANAGGFFGSELRYAGYDQVVLTGRAERPSYLLILDDRVEVRDAAELWGQDVMTTTRLLQAKHGQRCQVACVGPAAEHGVKFAGLFTSLVRAAARTGMGLAMAAKNLKAIAVQGSQPVTVADPERFEAAVEALNQRIRAHAEYESRKALGTTRLVSSLNAAGCLATRHFQTGRFEGAEAVSGEALAASVRLKSKACQSCTIPCSRYFRVTEGPYAGLESEGPEFEGLAGFSSRLGISELGAALKGVDLCNRLGLDVISTSECIAFLMELHQRGLLSREEADGLDLSWGNAQTAFALVEKIAFREGIGDLVADGVRQAAARLGRGAEEYAMEVKGLEIFQADPRGLKGYALGVAVASRGGDHLRSEPSFEFSEDAEEAVRRFGCREAAFRLEFKGKGRVVKFAEELSALADCLNACKNTITNMEVLSFDEAADLLRLATGLPYDGPGLAEAMERVVNAEKAFNAALGLTRKDDTLPRRFLTEPLPADSGPSAGSVVELDPMLDEYYAARGWDVASGLPTARKLADLGLIHEIGLLKARGALR